MKNQFLIYILFANLFLLNSQNLDSLQNVIKTTKDKETRVKALIVLAKKELYTNTEASEKNFRIALKEVENKKRKSDILNQLGVIFYKKSQFDSALVFYKKSSDISKKLKDTLQLAINYSNVANILRTQDKPDLAITNYLKALPIYVQKNKIMHQAMTFGAIGTLHLSLDQFNEALPYLKKAKSILQKIDNKQGVITTELNIAICLEKLHKIDEATSLLKKVVIDSKHNNYQRNYAIALSKLGKIYLLKNDYINAKEYYSNALHEFNKSNNLGGLAETNLFLGEIYYHENNFQKALNAFKNSLLFNEKSGIHKKSPKALEGIVKSLKRLGKTNDAIKYYELLLIAKDTVFNNNRRKIVAEINAKYNISEKEKELKIKQLEIEKKDAQLSKQKLFGIALSVLILLLLGLLYFVKKANKFKRLNEYNIIKKNKLAIEQQVLLNQMNPHFIFNALNSIQSYVSEKSDDATIYLAKFSRLIRLILENSRKEFAPFKEDYFTLVTYLNLEQARFDNSFDYEILFSDEIEETSIPPMLIQPFVENAIKHGIATIKSKGKITISYTIVKKIDDSEFGMLICNIVDNGIGLEKAANKQELGFKKHKSMSLELTKKRLANYTIDTNTIYKFTIKSNLNKKGTIVTIEIPYTL